MDFSKLGKTLTSVLIILQYNSERSPTLCQALTLHPRWSPCRSKQTRASLALPTPLSRRILPQRATTSISRKLQSKPQEEEDSNHHSEPLETKSEDSDDDQVFDFDAFWSENDTDQLVLLEEAMELAQNAAPVKEEEVSGAIETYDDDDDDEEFVLDAADLSSLLGGGAGDGTAGGGGIDGLQLLSLEDLRGFSSNVAYFYLRDELGLGEDIMWKITNQAGSILGLKPATLRNKVELLQESIPLSDEDVKQLVSNMPALLQLSAEDNIRPTIEFLKTELNLHQTTKDDLRTLILGCPALLSYAIPNLHRKILFFRSTMGLTGEETRKVLLMEPKLMTCSTETGLLPHFEFLRHEVGIPVENIRTIVMKNPKILQMSIDKNLQPKLIFYFIMTLSLTLPDVHRILNSFPGILNYSLENHLLPITRYFLSLDVTAHEYGRMLCRFPRLITNSLVKIKYVTGYLRFELGLEGDDVRRILYQAPQVVSLSSSNLQSKVEFLRKASSYGQPPPDSESADQPVSRDTSSTSTTPSSTATTALRKLIVGMPTLLYLSIEKNLAPKVDYLLDSLGEEVFAACLAKLPTLLGYSLENRIRPRLEQILDAGIEGASITVGITMKEEAFQVWLTNRTKRAKEEAQRRAKEESTSRVDSKLKQQPPQETSGSPRSVTEDGRVIHWTRKRQP